MKNIIKIFIILIIASISYAQQTGVAQSVELPEFVITGVRKVALPTVKKEKPELIALNFEKYTTDVEYDKNLFDTKISVPEFLELTENKKSVFNALLKGAIGTVTFPRGEFFYNNRYGGVLVNANIWGSSEREFVKDAGYNQAGAALSLNYFINHNTENFGGMGISFSTKYLTDSYNLYGSQTNLTRKTKNGSFKIGLSNNYSVVRYGFSFAGSYLKFDENKLSQTMTSIVSYMKFPVGNLNFNVKGEMEIQKLANNLSGKNTYNYLALMPEAKFKFSRKMEIAGGIFFSQDDVNTFFSPYLRLKTKLGKRLSAFAEFSPRSEFLTIDDFLTMNRFYKLTQTENIFLKRNNSIKFSLEYGFLNYFEIDGTLEYNRFENLPYFQRSENSGDFDIYKSDGVNDFSLTVNSYFDFLDFGKLTLNLKYQIIEKGGKQIPYYPVFQTEAVYWYGFENGVDASVRLNYSAKIYNDIENSGTIPDYLTFGFSIGYELFDNFKLTLDADNLFDRKNYLFENYRAKTLDVAAGFEYRW